MTDRFLQKRGTEEFRFRLFRFGFGSNRRNRAHISTEGKKARSEKKKSKKWMQINGGWWGSTLSPPSPSIRWASGRARHCRQIQKARLLPRCPRRSLEGRDATPPAPELGRPRRHAARDAAWKAAPPRCPPRSLEGRAAPKLGSRPPDLESGAADEWLRDRSSAEELGLAVEG